MLTACSAACIGQTLPATFHTQTYTERASNSPYAVDVNNDGVLDLVQILPTSSANIYSVSFTVRVANGNGSFRAPVVYTFASSEHDPTTGMAAGDFNSDGKVDLAFAASSGDQLTLFLGKGDGTFQPPKNITVALPSGQQFGSPLLAADFNGDGKLDLVASTFSTSTNSLYLIPGNGTGNFGTPALLYMPPANNFIGSYLAAGDFDADGRADIAFLDHYNCDKGNCFNALHVLYNDGNSQFTDTTVLSSLANELAFSAGDLNSDGRTDIFGVTS
ncbi:MAG TPA: VCBS repeat-containing protein, partial [Acidobacteriaceae bacterium]|nr:VCBS repeat-containing protein [Acidobacteriaceae bacterium]